MELSAALESLSLLAVAYVVYRIGLSSFEKSRTLETRYKDGNE